MAISVEYNGIGGVDYTKLGYYSVPSGVSRPLSEQVADLEKRKAQVEKELADLKAKRDAEAAKAKAQTYGEKVAEDLVRDSGLESAHVRGCDAVCLPQALGRGLQYMIAQMRKGIAAALDKAHADGRAVQREKDAKMFDEILSENYATVKDEYDRGRRNAFDFAADLIRNHK